MTATHETAQTPDGPALADRSTEADDRGLSRRGALVVAAVGLTLLTLAWTFQQDRPSFSVFPEHTRTVLALAAIAFWAWVIVRGSTTRMTRTRSLAICIALFGVPALVYARPANGAVYLPLVAFALVIFFLVKPAIDYLIGRIPAHESHRPPLTRLQRTLGGPDVTRDDVVGLCSLSIAVVLGHFLAHQSVARAAPTDVLVALAPEVGAEPTDDASYFLALERRTLTSAQVEALLDRSFPVRAATGAFPRGFDDWYDAARLTGALTYEQLTRVREAHAADRENAAQAALARP